jgi:hypothetical protein
MSVKEAIRALFPTMRRKNAVGITRNGSAMREYTCAGCGQSISCCSQWPVTVRVHQFIAAHNADCGQRLIARYIEANNIHVGNFVI